MRAQPILNAVLKAGFLGVLVAVAITMVDLFTGLVTGFNDKTPSRAEVMACAQVVADDLKNSAALADFVRSAADQRASREDFLTALCGDNKDCKHN